MTIIAGSGSGYISQRHGSGSVPNCAQICNTEKNPLWLNAIFWRWNQHLFLFPGILEEKIFEADPNIKYTFAWDRMNIYRQRVYGVTTANIKVQALCDMVLMEHSGAGGKLINEKN